MSHFIHNKPAKYLQKIAMKCIACDTERMELIEVPSTLIGPHLICMPCYGLRKEETRSRHAKYQR